MWAEATLCSLPNRSFNKAFVFAHPRSGFICWKFLTSSLAWPVVCCSKKYKRSQPVVCSFQLHSQWTCDISIDHRHRLGSLSSVELRGIAVAMLLSRFVSSWCQQRHFWLPDPLCWILVVNMNPMCWMGGSYEIAFGFVHKVVFGLCLFHFVLELIHLPQHWVLA